MPNTPYLLIDSEIAKRNISALAIRLQNAGISFEPHFKTHQSAEVGEWFRPYCHAISVSSWEMALYFAKNGWPVITLAYPFHPPSHDVAMALRSTGVRVNVLIDHPQQAALIKSSWPAIGDIYLEIDCGHTRSGLRWNDELRIGETLAALTRHDLQVAGIYSHFGDQYLLSDESERLMHLSEELQKLQHLRKRLGMHQWKIAIGDTPSSSLQYLPSGIDSFHSGNFVFYDMQQCSHGVCDLSQVALALITEVVSTYNDRNEFLIKAGAVHLSKDSYLNSGGRTAYGLVLPVKEKLWDIASPLGWIRHLSQEHAIAVAFAQLPDIGREVAVIPAHSCLTAAMFREYMDNESHIISKLQAF